MKYTIEEIEAAILKIEVHYQSPENISKKLIAELTNNPTFEGGQAVVANGGLFYWRNCFVGTKNARPLNQTECGPYPRAMHDALKRFANEDSSIFDGFGRQKDTDVINNFAKEVLSQMPEGWDQ